MGGDLPRDGRRMPAWRILPFIQRERREGPHGDPDLRYRGGHRLLRSLLLGQDALSRRGQPESPAEEHHPARAGGRPKFRRPVPPHHRGGGDLLEGDTSGGLLHFDGVRSSLGARQGYQHALGSEPNVLPGPGRSRLDEGIS